MIARYLLLLVPASLALTYLLHVPPVWSFAAAVLAIAPLAEWIRRSTVHLAARLGPAAGSVLNVTFGNFAELILALFVLRAGHAAVVKAQITGSIIGNGLLGLGLAVVVGSFGRPKQTFKRESAGRLAALLILSLIGLLLPALFDYTERGVFSTPNPGLLDERLSLGVSVVLILVYALNLVYTLVTHRNVFAADDPDEEAAAEGSWSLGKALGVLAVATAVTALEAEIASDALEGAATRLGLTPFFLGITVLAIVGNAAEYVAAVYFARRNRMGLVMGITVGSSIQVALLIAPLLVIASFFLGDPMNLVFSNPLELVAVAGVAFAVNEIAKDGETTWFEGVLLLAVYALLALAFLYATPRGAGRRGAAGRADAQESPAATAAMLARTRKLSSSRAASSEKWRGGWIGCPGPPRVPKSAATWSRALVMTNVGASLGIAARSSRPVSSTLRLPNGPSGSSMRRSLGSNRWSVAT